MSTSLRALRARLSNAARRKNRLPLGTFRRTTCLVRHGERKWSRPASAGLCLCPPAVSVSCLRGRSPERVGSRRSSEGHERLRLDGRGGSTPRQETPIPTVHGKVGRYVRAPGAAADPLPHTENGKVLA